MNASSPKYLLDTNVWRCLGSGDLPNQGAHLLGARQRGLRFYCADLSVLEVVRNLPADPSSFPRVQAALRWMDELAGNQGLAERAPLPLRMGLFRNPPPIQNDRREFNQLRRRLLHATAFNDLSHDDKALLRRFAGEFEQLVNEWVERAERAQSLIRNGNPIRKSHGERATRSLECVIADGLIDLFLEPAREAGIEAKRHNEIRNDLREFLHHHVGQVVKGYNREPYNYRKHRSDYIDVMLLTLCAAGYTLVTSDKRIQSTLRLGRCSNPRVSDLAAMVDAVTGHGATSSDAS